MTNDFANLLSPNAFRPAAPARFTSNCAARWKMPFEQARLAMATLCHPSVTSRNLQQSAG